MGRREAGFYGVGQPTQISIVGLRIIGWLVRKNLDFAARKLCAELVRYRSCYLALDRKDVGHLAVESVCPDMGIVSSLEQLDINPYSVTTFLHAAFNNM